MISISSLLTPQGEGNPTPVASQYVILDELDPNRLGLVLKSLIDSHKVSSFGIVQSSNSMQSELICALIFIPERLKRKE